ncbi:hypothetical protein CRG98_049900 [Punica granatum]|uniref:Uncharacterized protein n=1 Tax=Punica granatum TaxID=22663 RepID=A0A2I0H1L8_PUNGR|nr:hypothetical protein CRG98_049900 [Punica granatum]
MEAALEPSSPAELHILFLQNQKKRKGKIDTGPSTMTRSSMAFEVVGELIKCPNHRRRSPPTSILPSPSL